MKKIIKGKLYNTDTATLTGKQANRKELYRKKTGEYFLHDIEEKSITPLSYDQAKRWAKTNLHEAVYVLAFGPTDPAGDQLVQMKFYLKAKTAASIRRNSQVLGIQPSEFAENIFDSALNKE